MKTLRFKVGEWALLFSNADSLDKYRLEGAKVEITSLLDGRGAYFNKHMQPVPADYEIRMPSGEVVCAQESELRKLPPDADHLPPAVRSIFNVTPNQGLPVGPRPKEKAVGR